MEGAPSRGGITFESSRRWYDELRERYRPDPLKVLLVGESPPAPRGEAVPFFYADHLGADHLFRGVVEAVLGLDAQTLRREPKASILAELQERGLWLIHAVDEPVNRLPRPERRQRVTDGGERLVERCRQEAPEGGVAICHSFVYRSAAGPLRDAASDFYSTSPCPFPREGTGRGSCQSPSRARARGRSTQLTLGPEAGSSPEPLD